MQWESTQSKWGLELVIETELNAREIECSGYKKYEKHNKKSVIWMKKDIKAWLIESETKVNPSSVRIENAGDMWAVCEVTARGEELMEIAL